MALEGVDFQRHREQYVIEQRGASFFNELQRLTQTLNEMLDRIDRSVRRIVQFTADASHELRAPRGAFLVAYQGEEPVGCGGVKHLSDGPSDLKRMWVAESVRGLGLGRRCCRRPSADLHGPDRDSDGRVAFPVSHQTLQSTRWGAASVRAIGWNEFSRRA